MDKSEDLVVIPTRSTQDIQECFNNPAQILRRRVEKISGKSVQDREIARCRIPSIGVNHREDVMMTSRSLR